jgi:nucleoside phosphorylase
MTLGLMLAMALSAPGAGHGAKTEDVAVIMMAATSPDHLKTDVDQLVTYLDSTGGGGWGVKAEEAKLHVRLKDTPRAYLLRSAKLVQPILILESYAEGTESAMVVGAIENEFHVTRLLYGGSCGLLVNDHATLDLMVPSELLRSDLEYDDVDGSTLLFPEWKNAVLKDYFRSAYTVDLKGSPVAQAATAVALQPQWKAGVAAILKASQAPAVQGRTEVAVVGGVTHVTGGHFIAGIPARQRYHRVFGASSVDMRALPIVAAGRLYGSDSAAIMSCSDLAGSDHPDDAMVTFAKNFETSYQLALYASFLTLAPK